MTVKFGPRNEDEKQIFAIEGFRVDLQYAVQKLMKAQGVSRGEIARRLNISTKDISKFFLPTANPTAQTIAKLFFALNHECIITAKSTQDSQQKECGTISQDVEKGTVSKNRTNT